MLFDIGGHVFYLPACDINATKTNFLSEMTQNRISEAVYVGLCLKIGTPQQVAIRRDIVDIKELIGHKARTEKNVMRMSGSTREGFRLENSDVDFMFWPNHHPVLWYFLQAQFYNPLRDVVILCDSSDSPPGFTLLYLPLKMAACDILSTCIRINGLLYISSSKYRNLKCCGFPNSIVHGPCRSGRKMGMLDYDCAYCFASDFWPPSASSWLDRCRSWPLPCVVDDIIRSGCHLYR